MCLTGINGGFKLRIGQQTLGDDCRRKVRPIGKGATDAIAAD